MPISNEYGTRESGECTAKSEDDSGPRKMNLQFRLAIIGGVMVLILLLVFVWPTPYVYSEQQHEWIGGSFFYLVRKSRFTAREEVLTWRTLDQFNQGKSEWLNKPTWIRNLDIGVFVYDPADELNPLDVMFASAEKSERRRGEWIHRTPLRWPVRRSGESDQPTRSLSARLRNQFWLGMAGSTRSKELKAQQREGFPDMAGLVVWLEFANAGHEAITLRSDLHLVAANYVIVAEFSPLGQEQEDLLASPLNVGHTRTVQFITTMQDYDRLKDLSGLALADLVRGWRWDATALPSPSELFGDADIQQEEHEQSPIVAAKHAHATEGDIQSSERGTASSGGVNMDALAREVLEALRVNRVSLVLRHRIVPADIDELVIWKEKADGPMTDQQRRAFRQGALVEIPQVTDKIRSSFSASRLAGEQHGIDWEKVSFVQCEDGGGDDFMIFFRDEDKRYRMVVDSLQLPRGRLISGRLGYLVQIPVDE